MDNMNFPALLAGLRPKGQGFHEQGECMILGSDATTERLRTALVEYCEDLRTLILDKRQNRADRDEIKFICKAALICGSVGGVRRDFLQDREVLISLLCDRDILCSLQYQGYASTHGEYLAAQEGQIKDEQDLAVYVDMPKERQGTYWKLVSALKDKAAAQAKKSGTKYVTWQSVLQHFRTEMTFAYAADGAVHAAYKSAIESILGEGNEAAGELASLREDECRFFAETVFSQYVEHVCREERMKAATAQFRREYYRWQYESLKEGKELRKRIDRLWELAQAQYLPDMEAVAERIAGELMNGADKCLLTTSDGCSGGWSEELLAAAGDYAYCMNGRSRKSKEKYTARYLSAMLEEAGWHATPLMAVCALSAMRYACKFEETITADKLAGMILELHNANAEQRVAAMRFLKAILCELDSGVQCRKESWEALSVILGHAIASQEERDAWREVCATDCTGDSELPLIRLDILLQETADNKCITEQPERLYSYRRGSALQFGGYEQFLRERPETVDMVAGRILRDGKRWETICSEYWRMWCSGDVLTAEAAALCAEAGNLIRWSSIFNGYDVSALCKAKQREDVEMELKALLTEQALRKILNDRARDVLKDAARELLARGFGFPTSPGV